MDQLNRAGKTIDNKSTKIDSEKAIEEGSRSPQTWHTQMMMTTENNLVARDDEDPYLITAQYTIKPKQVKSLKELPGLDSGRKEETKSNKKGTAVKSAT